MEPFLQEHHLGPLVPRLPFRQHQLTVQRGLAGHIHKAVSFSWLRSLREATVAGDGVGAGGGVVGGSSRPGVFSVLTNDVIDRVRAHLLKRLTTHASLESW